MMKTIRARDLWRNIAEAAWECADPGIQFDTTINEWHTSPAGGRIRASNPCSEYMFLDNTACNLASLNLVAFYDDETGNFDIEAYKERDLTSGLQVGDDRPALPILATRGCPYQCTFCTSSNMWTTRYVTRSPKLLVDEIESYVRTYDVNNFPFQDLTVIIKKGWIRDFCRELIHRDVRIHWQLPSGTRSEAVDATIARLLKKSGMAHMAYAPDKLSMEKVESAFTPEDRIGALEMQALALGDNRALMLHYLSTVKRLGVGDAGGEVGALLEDGD